MITIIILSFNTKDLTLRAVRSCLDNAYKQVKVVVVDNDSSDGTVDALRPLERQDQRLSVMARHVNDGFASGNNTALRQVTTPYCMLLNSDAYIDAHSDIGVLVSYMESHDEVGMITPHVVLGNGHLDPASHRGFPNPWNAFTYYSGLERITRHSRLFGGYHETWKDITSIHPVDACSGAAMLIRTSAMRDVGLLDEQFFMYGEDLDWCYRFKAAGFKVMFHPGVVVHHDKHTSGLKNTTHQKRSRDAFYDAMRLFYKKHYAHVYPRFLQSLTFLGIDIVRKMKGH